MYVLDATCFVPAKKVSSPFPFQVGGRCSLRSAACRHGSEEESVIA